MSRGGGGDVLERSGPERFCMRACIFGIDRSRVYDFPENACAVRTYVLYKCTVWSSSSLTGVLFHPPGKLLR